MWARWLCVCLLWALFSQSSQQPAADSISRSNVDTTSVSSVTTNSPLPPTSSSTKASAVSNSAPSTQVPTSSLTPTSTKMPTPSTPPVATSPPLSPSESLTGSTQPSVAHLVPTTTLNILTSLPLYTSPSESLTGSTQPSVAHLVPTTTLNILTSLPLYTLPAVTQTPASSSPGSGVSTPVPTASKQPTTEMPTNPNSRSFPEFVEDNPIAFGMVVASALFVTCMCSILGCVLVWRRRWSSKRKAIRRQSILEQAGDVWIVNQGASLYENEPSRRHIAAVNALQTAPDEALVFANPAQSPPPPTGPPLALPQYHQLQTHSQSPHLVAASPQPTQSTSSLGQMTSTTSLMTQITPLLPQQYFPSAPPEHHI